MSYFCDDKIEDLTTEQIMEEGMKKMNILELALTGIDNSLSVLSKEQEIALLEQCLDASMLFCEVNERLQGTRETALKLAA